MGCKICGRRWKIGRDGTNLNVNSMWYYKQGNPNDFLFVCSNCWNKYSNKEFNDLPKEVQDKILIEAL